MKFHHDQGKTVHSFANMPVIPERHLVFQDVNGPGDSGLVLSPDAKPRLKWTNELHKRFIDAVCQLSEAEKATPKTVMKVMGIPGLTLYHLKSHLQAEQETAWTTKQWDQQNGYVKSQLMTREDTVATQHSYFTQWSSLNLRQSKLSTGCTGAAAMAQNRVAEANGIQTSFIAESQMNSEGGNSRRLETSEALQMQIEVQRRLHEQPEVQRHLQVRIEAQGKYLQSVLEKAEETLGRQNLGAVGVEAAKVQLSDLVSKVSPECLAGAFPELQRLCIQFLQQPDCSFESSLTSSEGSRKDVRASNGGGEHLDAKERGEGQGGPKRSEAQRKGSLCSIEKERERSTKFYGASSLGLNAGEEDETDGCSDNKQLDLNSLTWDGTKTVRHC